MEDFFKPFFGCLILYELYLYSFLFVIIDRVLTEEISKKDIIKYSFSTLDVYLFYITSKYFVNNKPDISY